MAYTYTDGITPTYPDGAAEDADDLDTIIQNVIKAYNERWVDMFGVTMTDDPLAPTKLGLLLAGTSSQVKATYYDAGNTSTALAINWNNGNTQKCTLTGNVTFTMTNPVAGSFYSLELIQDGTGGRTMTFPASMRWTNNSSAPTFVTTAARVTLITLYWTGAVYLATLAGTGFNVS